ncbi:MAG: 1,4-dihydroxy-6-naphthoate synthase [Syntrophotaleaceae bacterium]
MRGLSLGYSPCPNDTCIFFALVHGRIPLQDLAFQERLEDVETLNRLACSRRLDVTKISYHALGHLRSDYALLRSGGALGRGCGPLLVARHALTLPDLEQRRIAIPGRLTTATLLLQLCGRFENLLVMPFDRIMPAVRDGLADAGLIIHEGRFTYHELGLVSLLDLGQWWEETTGLPIPLGGILARRDLGPERIKRIEEAVRKSVAFALAHPGEAAAYIRRHAQELDEEVIRRHIGLYVNDYSLDLGDEGLGAVRELLKRAEERGLIPRYAGPLFAE